MIITRILYIFLQPQKYNYFLISNLFFEKKNAIYLGCH